MATSEDKQIPRVHNFELVEGMKLQVIVLLGKDAKLSNSLLISFYNFIYFFFLVRLMCLDLQLDGT